MRYNQKRALTCSKRAQLWIFTPHFYKFRAFRTLHPPKWHVFFEFLVEKKAFHSSKRALRPGTARNKTLKKALTAGNFCGSIVVTYLHHSPDFYFFLLKYQSFTQILLFFRFSCCFLSHVYQTYLKRIQMNLSPHKIV